MAKLKNTRVYGNLQIDDILLVSQDATILGNLNVSGTVTTVNSTTVQIVDPIAAYGGGANGAALTTNDGKDRGLDFKYYVGSTGTGTAKDAFMGWQTGSNTFVLASNVGITSNQITVDTYGNLTMGVITADGGGLSNVPGSSVTGNVATANYANYAGQVTGSSQGNITSLGTLTTLTVGNSTANTVFGNGTINASGTITGLGNLYIGNSSSNNAVANVYGDLNVTGNLNGRFTGTIGAKGANTNIQFNDQGNQNGVDGFTFVKTSNTVNIGSSYINGDSGDSYFIGNVVIGGNAIVDDNSLGIDLYSGNFARLNYSDNAYVTVNGTGVSLVAGYTGTAGYYANLSTTTGQFTLSNAFSAAAGNFTVNQNGNVNAAGFGSFANVYDTGLTQNQIVYPDSVGKLVGSAGLTYASNTLSANNFATTNANISGNITTKFTGGNLLSTDNTGNVVDSNVTMSAGSLTATNVTATANLQGANLTVTSLTTNGGILYTNTSGNVSESSGLTFTSDTLTANNITTGGTANVANLQVTSLTTNEVPYSDGTGLIKGASSFTYTPGTSTLQANNVTASQLVKGANVQSTSLTLNEVVYSDSTGILTGSSAFTYDPGTSTLTANTINAAVGFNSSNVHATNLNNHAIVIADGTGKLVDDTTNGFAYYTSNATLTSNNVSAANTITAINVLAANIGNSATQLYGNGINISNIAGANVSGTVANANYAAYAGQVVDATQSNITAVGTLTSLSVSGTGSITGANLVSANYVTGTLTTAAQPNITSVGNLTSLTSNGNILISNANPTNGILTDNLYYSNGTAWDLQQAAGTDTQIQYNSGNNFAASSKFTFDPTSNTLSVTGNANITTVNATTGNITTVNATNVFATTGNITTVNATTVVATTGNITTVNVKDIEASGNANITGWLNAADTVITGNLTVTGTTTSVNTTTTQLTDPLFELGGGPNGASLTTNDAFDRGLFMHTRTAGTNKDLFMGWSAANSEFVLAKNVTVTNNVVDYGTTDVQKQANLADLRLGNIFAYNANFGGVVFSQGNVTLGTGSYLNGDVNGNIMGNIKVKGPNGAIQFTSNYDAGVGHGDLNVNSNLTFVGNTLSVEVGNGGIVAADKLTGTLTTNAQPNVTSLGTLANLSIDGGNLSIANNSSSNHGIKTDYIYKTDGTPWDFARANGSATWIQYSDGTDLKASANLTFDDSTQNLTVNGNIITGTGSGGNITGANEVHANYFYGDGSNLTNVTATSMNAANLTGDTLASGVIHSSLQDVGTLTSLSVTGDLTVATGNITATAGNVSGNVITGNLLTGTLTTNAQPNVTSLGTLTSVTVSGNANVGNISTNAVSNTQVVYGDNKRLVGSAGFTFDATSNTLSVSGSANVGNLTITSGGTVTGNIIPSANVTYNLGSPTARFKDLYLSGTSIYLGPQTISANATAVTTTADISAGNIFDTSLVASRITFASTGGLLVDSANLTFSGTELGITGTANVSGTATAGNLQSTGLTNTRITYAGTNGLLVDSANLTFNGTELGVTGTANVSGTATAGNLQSTGLTSTRVTFASTGGLLVDSANLTFSGTELGITGSANISGTVNAGNVTSNNVSTNQVVFATTGNLLTSSSSFKYYNSNSTLVVDNFKASSSANLGAVGNITITGSTAGQYLRATAGNGLEFANVDTSLLANGNSNVHIATLDGNVTVAVAGTTIIDVGTAGMTVTGIITATGNITAANIISNASIIASGTTDSTNAVTGTITTAGGMSAQGNIYAGKAVGFAHGSGNTDSAAYIQYNATAGSLDFIFN